MEKIFETASFHIVKACNMRCKFCYATFDDVNISERANRTEVFDVLAKLKDAGLQKITFAWGEPMLYKHIKDVIRFSHDIGLTTSIITNGSRFSWHPEFLGEMRPYLDWVGISIDSTSRIVNERIGRSVQFKNDVPYIALIGEIKSLGYKLKINTVVNRYNHNEYIGDFIKYANPERWKVFKALRVVGQNDKSWDEIKITDAEFQSYVARHSNVKQMVAEDNDLMTGSYLLIDQLGRLFENTNGVHTYSDPLQHSTVEKCLAQLNFNRERFIARGGIYEW